MIFERGRVARTESGFAWVVCDSQIHCERCAEGRGCGGGLLGRWLGGRLHEVRAVAPDPYLRPGDVVVVGLAESAILRAALAVYLIPLMSMLSGALAATWILAGSDDAVALLGGSGGLLAGLLWVRRFSRRAAASRRYQPVVARRVGAAGSPSSDLRT